MKFIIGLNSNNNKNNNSNNDDQSYRLSSGLVVLRTWSGPALEKRKGGSGMTIATRMKDGKKDERSEGE